MTRNCLLIAAMTVASPAFAAPPPVTALAYRPDGQLLAAGTRGVVHLIDPATGEVTVDLPGQTGRVTAAAFSRSGVLAVASGEPGKSGVVRLYDTCEPKATKPTAEFAAHKDAVYALAFSPDGKTLATAGLRPAHPAVGPSRRRPPPSRRLTLKDHSDAVYGARLPPGRQAARLRPSADRAVKVWDAATGKRLYTLGDPTDWVYAVAWSPDGKHLAAAGVGQERPRLGGGRGRRQARSTSVFAHERRCAGSPTLATARRSYSAGEDRVVKAWDAAKMVETKAAPRATRRRPRARRPARREATRRRPVRRAVAAARRGHRQANRDRRCR